MSAVAAPAVLPRPRTFVSGAARRRLRSVPAQAGPVARLEVGNPLQLTETMRTRLLAAVRALLSDPGLKDADDPVRLAAVVLMAKAKVAKDYRATITATDLGRWVGLKPSRIGHHVLPQLRDRGVVGSNETVSAAGRVTGLKCWVIPMYRAQHGGDRRHVLALSRVELVVLLALIEALFAPGWNHKDGRVTPAGMLADRTGRGAATDRLGLLLMVLSSNAKGWLQLCSGSVDGERGRPAATVARLLGCSPAGGAKVLSRLQEWNVLSVDRRETASGLNARSRVRLLPVAQAHGIAVREAHEATEAVFSDLAVTACGDLETMVEAVIPVVTGVQGAGEGLESDSADRADAAHLHASHASVVTPGGSLSLSGGFSGEGRGAEGPLPECACDREDQAVDGEDAAAVPGPRAAKVGPLRGEQPKESPADEPGGQLAARPGAGGQPQAVRGEKTQQQRRVDLPEDLGLRVALGPVSWLWQGLSGFQQAQVEAAAEAELGRLKGWMGQQDGAVRREAAARRLAARLAARLDETGGEARVDRPYGWLMGRGLVQRQACADRRCDDGARLDTGAACENCANVLHVRRAHRARIVAEVGQELPGLDDAARRQVVEERLQAQTAADAARFVRRREEARVRDAEREAARAAAQERAELERQAAAVAATVRQALACEDCGQTGAGGLCEACGCRRETETLTVRAVQLVAARTLDPAASAADVAALDVRVRTAIGRKVAAEWAEFLELSDPADLEDDQERADLAAALTAHSTVQQIADQAETSALTAFGRTDEADTEADRAYRTEQGRRWFQHNPTGEAAVAAATKAATTARNRVAQHLLALRLKQLREQAATGHRAAQAGAGSWMDRMPELAARALGRDATGAVIA